MTNNERKIKKEAEILNLLTYLSNVEDKKSCEYKKLLQKIYTPIWDWLLLCFNETDVRNAGVEIFHCIKRTLLKYDDGLGSSYMGYLYSSLENEIRHKKEKGEVKKFRMCTRDDYNRAIRLIKTAKEIGKNPFNENVQIWLSKQCELDLDKVKDLILKYYQSQIVAEQITNNEGEEVSLFNTDAVQNNYLTPEERVFKTEYALDDLKKIERAFDKCQERQKVYLSSFITLKVLQALERTFLIGQIVDLLQKRNFIDLELLNIFTLQAEMPTQSQLAVKFGKDEGYISNRISDFFEKVQQKSIN
jgi:hypothetical protein